jgi:transposase-like protein
MAQPILSAPHFWNEEAAFAFLEARIWPDGQPICPKCGVIGQSKRLHGKTTRPGLWKCYACMKPFTVKVGTVFESSHVPLHIWLQTVHLIASSKKGISTHQIHRTMGVTLKTAWFMTMRIREAMKAFGFEPLGGPWRVVEGDETYIGGKAANRAYSDTIPPKQIVMTLVERGGGVRSFHVPNVNAANLQPIIAKHVHTDSRYVTDTSTVAGFLGLPFRGRHQTVNHSAKEYVRGDVYTNTVEGYFSILKRGIYGVYQHVSEAHLQRYLAEFDFRYTYRIKTGYDDAARTDLILEGAWGRRLTYRTTRGARPAVSPSQAPT